MMKINWKTIRKVLQILATVITTLLGANVIESCM